MKAEKTKKPTKPKSLKGAEACAKELRAILEKRGFSIVAKAQLRETAPGVFGIVAHTELVPNPKT